MRKKITKFPSKVLNQLLYKEQVIADGYYLQYVMNERVDVLNANPVSCFTYYKIRKANSRQITEYY